MTIRQLAARMAAAPSRIPDIEKAEITGAIALKSLREAAEANGRGSYRTIRRNIGIEAYRIPTEIRQAIDDARYWVKTRTYSPDEIAVRFSHRVVAIHPFLNGNGRFSRLIGGMLAIQLGQKAFTWGSANLIDANKTRHSYVATLRAADAHDIGPLLAFARS